MKIWFDTIDYEAIDDNDFTLETVKALYDNIVNGADIETACDVCMIPLDKYYSWLEQSEEFKLLMQHAQAKYRADIMRKITNASKQNPIIALKQMQAILKAQNEMQKRASKQDIFDELAKIVGEK